MDTSNGSGWGARALRVARGAAVFTATTAPMSTAAASLGSAVFLLALLVSGRALAVVAAAFRLPAGKAIFAFLAWVLLSSTWSAAGTPAALHDAWAWRKLAFLALALPLFVDPVWKRRMLLVFVCTCGVAMVLSYISFTGLLPYRFDTPGVMLTNYAVQGAAFAIAALCAVQLAIDAQGRTRWLFAVLAAALVVNVLFFNFGRTGYLALAGATLAWAVLAGGWRWSAAAACALVVLFGTAYAVSPTFHDRIARGLEEVLQERPLTMGSQMGLRVLFLKNSLALIRERPIAGYGLGSFKPVYAAYVDRHHTGIEATHAGDPHNQYVYITFEEGLVGLALFLVAIAALLKTFPRDPYGRLAACALTAWCLTSLFSSHFRTFPEGHFYAFLVAVLGATAARRATPDGA